MAIIASKLLLFSGYISRHFKIVCRNATMTIVLIVSIPVISKAQVVDTIHTAMKTKPKIIFRFDSRNSFIDNSRAKIFGWKIGVEFNNLIRIGGGFSSLVSNHNPSLDKVIYEENLIDTFRIAELQFDYICYFIDYIFFSTRRWEFSVPVQIGIGGSKYEYMDENSKLQVHNAKSVIMFEPAISIQYKITKWFGLGAGAGYRLMLINNRAIDKKFNSPIYIFKFKVFLGDIVRSFSRKHEEEKKQETR